MVAALRHHCHHHCASLSFSVSHKMASTTSNNNNNNEIEISLTPPVLRELADNATNKIIPKKSSPLYEKEYKTFQEWCVKNDVQVPTENVLLAYFETLGKSFKSSSLWTKYSMLRSMLNIKQQVDISRYCKLIAFLKQLKRGYEPKKSKVLQSEEIEQFITEAPNLKYLGMKVVLIMGYSGACRREELKNMTTEDVEFKENSVFVTVPKTKTNSPRMFAVTNEIWIDLIRKYVHLRPAQISHNRFFLKYHEGKCSTQPVGINKFGEFPKEIAGYLNLPNKEQYTGHCFRRSSASHIANEGGDLITVKTHGGWRSSTVAESYIEISKKRKIEVANMFITESSTSAIDSDISCQQPQASEKLKQTTFAGVGNSKAPSAPPAVINAQEGCTINIYTNCVFHK